MRHRKPDLLMILAFLLCLGVVLTSYGQAILEAKEVQTPSKELYTYKRDFNRDFNGHGYQPERFKN